MVPTCIYFPKIGVRRRDSGLTESVASPANNVLGVFYAAGMFHPHADHLGKIGVGGRHGGFSISIRPPAEYGAVILNATSMIVSRADVIKIRIGARFADRGGPAINGMAGVGSAGRMISNR